MRTMLKPGERVVREFAKHWITLAGPAVIVGVALLGIVAVFTHVNIPTARLGSQAAALLAVLHFVYRYVERTANLWCVTNQRIVDEWGVFSRNSKETALDRILNVTYKQPLLGLLLGYGNVEIQTAAEQGSTIVKMVEQPAALRETIQELAGENQESDDDTKECPFCAETVKVRAVKCKHCGSDLEA